MARSVTSPHRPGTTLSPARCSARKLCLGGSFLTGRLGGHTKSVERSLDAANRSVCATSFVRSRVVIHSYGIPIYGTKVRCLAGHVGTDGVKDSGNSGPNARLRHRTAH